MDIKRYFNLAGVTFVVLVAAIILFVVGFATPNWVSEVGSNTGLWQMCASVHGSTTCTSIPSNMPDWFIAVQALEAIGLAILIFAESCASPYLFKESLRKPVLAKSVIGLSFLAGAVIIAGVIVFGVEYSSAPIIVGNLNYSFALTIVGGALSLIAGLLSAIHYKASSALVHSIV